VELLEQGRSRAVQLGGQLGDGGHSHVFMSLRVLTVSLAVLFGRASSIRR
jgi:hypothetical protein